MTGCVSVLNCVLNASNIACRLFASDGLYGAIIGLLRRLGTRSHVVYMSVRRAWTLRSHIDQSVLNTELCRSDRVMPCNYGCNEGQQEVPGGREVTVCVNLRQWVIPDIAV